MRLQLPVFRIDHERSPAELRRHSFLLIPIGAILVVISSVLLALALGMSIPADWLPSSITVDPKPNEQGVSVGAALFACFILVFGLVTLCEGLWRLLLGKVNSLLLRSMLVLGALFVVSGFIASGVLGRRFPSLNSNESLPIVALETCECMRMLPVASRWIEGQSAPLYSGLKAEVLRTWFG